MYMKFKNSLGKIYITLGIWALLVVFMFVFGFKIVENSNAQEQAKLASLVAEMHQLQAERDSFNNAKKDLDKIAQKTLQPEDFFSQDITLVREVEFFENLASRLGVKMNLSGPSGTVKSAAPVKSLSGQIISVPLNLTVTGTFSQVVEFAEVLEHLPFAMQVSSLSLSTLSANQVSATFIGSFYLRK